MSCETGHGDDAIWINFKVQKKEVGGLLRCDVFRGMIEGNEAIEVAVDADIIVKQTRR